MWNDLKMGQRKRQRTAQRHLAELDRKALGIADEAIQEHNFRKLIDRGVIVWDEVEEAKICDKCKVRPAMHTSWCWWKKPDREDLCCQCHIENGGTPADWHPICMKNSHRIIGAEQCKKTQQ